MEQTERINYMEGLFDLVSAALEKPSLSHSEYNVVRRAIAVLSEYYESDEWREDYAADEAGLLSKELKRGVLSEDGLWNLLSEWRER